MNAISKALQLAMLATLAFAATNSQAKEPDKFVVHEWGTFSTFSGSDGKQLKFTPNERDLPAFVHARHRQVKGGLADAMVSLETPVLYFYTDRDRTVSVHVDFPKGLMTDWYPEASRPPEHSLRWDNLKILANERPKLAGEREMGRYFAARATDAASVRTAGSDSENEKFLFYRGIGDFNMPLVVKARGSRKFTVKNAGDQALPAYILVGVNNRKVSFTVRGQLAPAAEEQIKLPATTSSAEKLGDVVAKILMKQGLYEKEARAMVKTWSGDWFGDDGTRVLYFLAEPTTAAFLPLTIEPKPDRQVRVLVGRHDVLTPEREYDIDDCAKQLNGPSNAASKAADTELNKLGRYRWAAQKAAEDRLKADGRTRADR